MGSEHRRLVERLQDKNTSGDGSFRYVEGTLGGNHVISVSYTHLPEMQAAYKAIATAGSEMDSVDANKFRILNMLNTKYFIFPAGQQRQTVPILNPHAYGNAWVVNKVQYVNLSLIHIYFS